MSATLNESADLLTCEAVTDALDGDGCCDSLAAKLRAIAAPRPATVGELLATAPAGSIVEWLESDEWRRVDMRIGPGAVEYWCASDLRWRSDDGYLWPSAMRHRARLVAASEADADPNQRGPLPKGG